MSERILTLIGNQDPSLLEAVRAVSDRLELISPADLEARPELLAQIEIAFGGLNAARITHATRLRWLQTGGAGVNGLIPAELCESALIVTNASGIHAEPITEHMFGMLLMVTRRLDLARERQQARAWSTQGLSDGVSMLAGKTLGVLGVGAIGGHSAHVGQAFGMRVVGLRRSGEPHPHVERMYSAEERLEFFREADVVMNSLPLTERTRHAISWEELAALKTGSIVINTGRGGTINTDALVASLRSGHLGAALLDVTDPEPLSVDHPLWSMENVYITPHYSGSHPGSQQRAGRIFLDNLRRYLAGEPMVNVVDKTEGY